MDNLRYLPDTHRQHEIINVLFTCDTKMTTLLELQNNDNECDKIL